MIREQDLLEAIAECQGQKNPNANTCIKLAAYYTILDHIREPEQEKEMRDVPPASFTGGYSFENRVGYDSGSEFSQMILDADPVEVWSIMDELMSTIKILHPRLYDGVMRKLDGLH